MIIHHLDPLKQFMTVKIAWVDWRQGEWTVDSFPNRTSTLSNLKEK